jgi:prepilin-type N-terminal cleavage/methylation domain-containing protein
MLIRRVRGFTLVELFVVVGILGMLATVAIPKYYVFVCRAKTTEARSMLGGIFIAEETYRAEHDLFIGGDETDLTAIGMTFVAPARYTYSVPTSSVTATTFEAHANAHNQSIQGDHWTIDQDSNLLWLSQAVDCN